MDDHDSEAKRCRHQAENNPREGGAMRDSETRIQYLNVADAYDALGERRGPGAPSCSKVEDHQPSQHKCLKLFLNHEHPNQ